MAATMLTSSFLAVRAPVRSTGFRGKATNGCRVTAKVGNWFPGAWARYTSHQAPDLRCL
jgi:hypothetical protein